MTAICRTCGGQNGNHQPSMLDPNGRGDPGHRVEGGRPTTNPNRILDEFDMAAIWSTFNLPRARKTDGGGVELIPNWPGALHEIGRQVAAKLDESITEATHPPVPGMTPDFADGWRSAIEAIRIMFDQEPSKADQVRAAVAKVEPADVGADLLGKIVAAGDALTDAMVKHRAEPDNLCRRWLNADTVCMRRSGHLTRGEYHRGYDPNGTGRWIDYDDELNECGRGGPWAETDPERTQ